MEIKCIFCLADKESSKEHIIPESIGGRLVTNAVCKSCNSILGHNVDGPFSNSFPIQLARGVFNISGKSGPQKPFKNKGTAEIEGESVNIYIDGSYKPKVETKVRKEGDGTIKVILDKNNADELQNILYKILIKEKGWQGKETELKDHVQHIIKSNAVSTESQPVVNYSFQFDYSTLTREMIKIAYETICLNVESKYLSTPIAEELRNTIIDDAQSKRISILDTLPTVIIDLLGDIDTHVVVIIFNCVFVKLFGFYALIFFDEQSGNFNFNIDTAKIYLQKIGNPIESHNLLEYLSLKLNGIDGEAKIQQIIVYCQNNCLRNS